MMSYNTKLVFSWQLLMSLPAKMTLVYLWTTTWLLSFMSSSPPPGDNDSRTSEQVSLLPKMTAPLQALIIVPAISRIYATMASYTTSIDVMYWLHAIIAWKHLHLHVIATSPVKYYINYWKHFKYGRNWTPPGCCLILHKCIEAIRDCCTAHV